MYVVAAPGIKVPKEHKPHDYIEQETIEVPDDSAYYLRRINDGDLLVAETKPEKKVKGAE